MEKRSISAKLFAFVIAVVFVVYLGYQVYTLITEPVRTVQALKVTVDDSILTEGYFARSEMVLVGPGEGTPVFYPSSGEKVAKNARIAEFYQSASAADEGERLSEISQQIDDLEYVLAQAEGTPDTAKLDQSIRRLISDVGEQSSSGLLAKSEESVESLKSYVLRRDLAYSDLAEVETLIASLKAERTSLSAKLTGGFSSLTAPAAGFFTSVVDGYESVLTPDTVGDMTVAAFDALDEARSAIDSDAVGRITTDFKWRFVTCLPEEDALKVKERMRQNRTVRLRVGQMLTEDLTVSVERVGPAEDGRCVVVFSGTQVGSELLTMRHQQVEIVLRRYEGIKIPKEARRQVDDKWGVYCLAGQRAVFKTIEPIFETESYVLIEADGSKSGQVFIHDEIIVSGKGIKNKQVIG